MVKLADLKTYARYVFGLPSFLRHPISLEESRAIVRRRLADRERNFLRLVERGVFGYAKSPYRCLFELAGCEFGDVRNLVESKGVEATLEGLRDAGVYVTFEEFKGREPIVRGGHSFRVASGDFDNPYLSRYFFTETGGSTGAGTRVSTDLDHLAAQAPHMMLTREAHGVLNVPTAIWRPILPAGSGIHNVLRAARFGRVPQKWFSPVTGRDLAPSPKHRIATYGTIVVGRLCGLPMPWPQPLSMDQAVDIARWAVDTVKKRGACMVGTPVSCALRVCVAAQKEGLDLTGTTFMVAGEPPTPAKVGGIERSGARYFTTYGLAETGRVGMGCTRPVSCNDLHFLKDSFALVQMPVQVPTSDMVVPAFCLTSLLPSAPKLLLNVAIDDYGVFEHISCGCPLEALGFSQHMREIHSYRKLTGEGMSLVGSEMVRILDEVLPARFGGSPLDYQLLEEEDKEGFTCINIIVSPQVDIVDETAVVQTVLQSMGESGVGADLMRAIWHQAGILRVRRSEPVWTDRGKLMPLRAKRTAKPT